MPSVAPRRSRLATALLLAGAVLLVLLPGLARAAEPSTTVSLTFDDGYLDQYEHALPALSAHGMHATFYTITGLINGGEGNPEYMTWAQLHDVANAGNEIAGHTVLHDKLTTLTTTEAEREVCNDRINLIDQGFQPTDFAYPNGAYNPTLEQIVEHCGYNSARTVGGIVSPFDEQCMTGCPFAEGIPPSDPYAFRTPDSVVSTMTLSDLETLVLQAEAHGGGWVPIVFHQICEVECREPSISPASFDAFLNWLSQQSENGTVTVKTVHEVIGGAFKPGVPGPPPAGTSLQNPSLENPANGEEPATCWLEAGYGNNTASLARTDDAHTGAWAAKLTVSNYASGDAKALVRLDEGDCAPEVTPGRAYTVSSWYKSGTSMNLVVFYRDQIGAWHYLTTSPAFSATSSWTDAQWTTPAMPSDATAISFGPDLTSNGSVTFDDLGLALAPPTVSLNGLLSGMTYSGVQTLSANAGTGTDHVDFLVNGSVVGTATESPWSVSWDSHTVANGPVTITARAVDAKGASSSASVNASVDNSGSSIKNASLEWDANADSMPDCWQTSGFGANSFTWSRTSDAHSGNWAERVEITSFTSGDRKLLQNQDSGLCAPAVTPGRSYRLSAWFKSSISPYLVVFTRNSSGAWSFWTSSTGFAGSATSWTQAAWNTPPIPAGTTNISFGLDLSTVGFLTVDDFALACDSCDTIPPASSASAPALSNQTSWSVGYTASDGEGGSGLAEVDLYAKTPGQSAYGKVASDTSGAGSGSFSYSAKAGDGAYSFYTIATDREGNVQAAPASPDATTLLDTTPPSSQASAPASSSASSWSVSYTAADNEGGSGLAEVDLYAKAPGQSAYSKVASDTSGTGSGSFTYAPGAGNGTYSFYTVASDTLGNVEAAPATPDASTAYSKDTTPPTSTASAPAYSNTTTWSVSYTASDNGGGDALASVELWARPPGAKAFAKVATETTAAASGSFTYTGLAGDGSYALYTIAVDQAGNRQALPTKANATTMLDTVAPSAFEMASPGQYLRLSPTLSLASTPTDSGSGMASVSYQFRASGSAEAWASACQSGSSPWSCKWKTQAVADGLYELRAVAADRAGNATVASNTPLGSVTVQNAQPAAATIATANAGGGAVGKPESGDSITFTYSTVMRSGSILEGWTGAATPVLVKLVAKSSTDTTLTVWSSAGTTQLALANPLDLGRAYVPKAGAVFNATITQTGAAIQLTLGSLAGGSVLAAPASGGTVTWTPSAKATDLAGNKCSTAKVSTPGPAF